MENSVMVNYYKINNKDYIIVNEKDYKNKHYVYLVNEEDSNDILIRNLKNDVLLPLDSEEEFIEVMELMVK